MENSNLPVRPVEVDGFFLDDIDYALEVRFETHRDLHECTICTQLLSTQHNPH